MITVSCLATLLFLGGWNAPFGLTQPWSRARLVRAQGVACFCSSTSGCARRCRALRYDRLMAFGWKVLLPVATLNLIVTAVVVAVLRQSVDTCARISSTSARSSRGLRTTFSFHVREEADDRIPVGARSSMRRASTACTNCAATPTARSAASAASCARSRVPRMRSPSIGAENAPSRPPLAWRALRGALRDRRAALHLLRAVRRSVPDRCDRADARASRWPTTAAARSSTRRIVCWSRPRPGSGTAPDERPNGIPSDLGLGDASQKIDGRRSATATTRRGRGRTPQGTSDEGWPG